MDDIMNLDDLLDADRYDNEIEEVLFDCPDCDGTGHVYNFFCEQYRICSSCRGEGILASWSLAESPRTLGER